MTGTLTPDRITDVPPVETPRRRLPWERLGVGGLLLGTGLLYLVGLSASGWANQFYAAAAQAGAHELEGVPVRLAGPVELHHRRQAARRAVGHGRVGEAVRHQLLVDARAAGARGRRGRCRCSTPPSAGSARTPPGCSPGPRSRSRPVAALMFRFDNPDALLVLLMTGAAYATIRARRGRPAAVARARRRAARLRVPDQDAAGHARRAGLRSGLSGRGARAGVDDGCATCSLAGGAPWSSSAGWWIALVELWPAGSRPFIGGSTDNSVLELIFGYNGVGRLTGADNNGAVGGPGGTTTGGGFSSGQTGLTRLFGTRDGRADQLAAAGRAGRVAALGRATWRRPRTDALRASVLVWGGWLLVTGIVFSFASGIIHPYYTVALAPAIAALVGPRRRRAVATARGCGRGGPVDARGAGRAVGVVDLRPARPGVLASGAALDRRCSPASLGGRARARRTGRARGSSRRCSRCRCSWRPHGLRGADGLDGPQRRAAHGRPGEHAGSAASGAADARAAAQAVRTSAAADVPGGRRNVRGSGGVPEATAGGTRPAAAPATGAVAVGSGPRHGGAAAAWAASAARPRWVRR